MIRITLMDGKTMEIPRSEVREVLPLPILYSSKYLQKNISAIFSRCGKVIPVVGLLPDQSKAATKNTWMLLCDEKAYIISGLPVFLEDVKTPNLRLAEPVNESVIADTEEEEMEKEIEELERLLSESA